MFATAPTRLVARSNEHKATLKTRLVDVGVTERPSGLVRWLVEDFVRQVDDRIPAASKIVIVISCALWQRYL